MGKINNIEYVDINDLIPYANNTKVHPKKQLEKIADSIREFGFISPVLIDENNNIIAGHGRVLASKTIGIEKIPCVRVDGLTEEQRKAYVIADNKLSELGTWNKELVASELSELSLKNFDIKAIGFSSKDVSNIVDELNKSYGAERERTNNTYNLDIAHLTDLTSGFWQMPILHKCDYIPERLVGFNYAKSTENKKCGIHFFIDDYQFERIWNNPEKYIDILNQYECILTPDFSLYMDMPMPMKIWNVYRSRQIGAFYQSLGLNVIPTISWAEKETFDFCFEGVEKNSIVAVSTIGVKRDKTLMQTWKDGMNEMIERINPSCILVYGGEIEYNYKNILVKYYKNDVTENWKKEGC